jgi:hypothetical protein
VCDWEEEEEDDSPDPKIAPLALHTHQAHQTKAHGALSLLPSRRQRPATRRQVGMGPPVGAFWFAFSFFYVFRTYPFILLIDR